MILSRFNKRYAVISTICEQTFTKEDNLLHTEYIQNTYIFPPASREGHDRTYSTGAENNNTDTDFMAIIHFS